ncbi:MAG: UrcA family protein [Hyphomonas sp.]|uniref:UrcA family protein n=1 Tax=Hyphomonas sp. TaxID=87 RepID=UPI0035278E5D
MTSRILPLALTAALAGSLFFAAPASAEIQRQLELDVQYDVTALSTATGAETVLDSLLAQAEDACSYARPIAGADRLDRACAAEVVAKAVQGIGDAGLTEAYEARFGQAQLFASLD